MIRNVPKNSGEGRTAILGSVATGALPFPVRGTVISSIPVILMINIALKSPFLSGVKDKGIIEVSEIPTDNGKERGVVGSRKFLKSVPSMAA